MEEVTAQSQQVDPFAYSHVIFDFDDTLAKLLIDWPKWHPMITQLIQRFEPDFVFTDKSQTGHFAIHQYINRYGQKFYDEFLSSAINFEVSNYSGYGLIPHSLNLLKQLHQAGKKLYLLTSNCREVVAPVLEDLEITDFFKRVITVNDVSNLKPTAAPFELIKEDSVPLNKYLMVGDSESDSGFAENIGIAYLDVRDI